MTPGELDGPVEGRRQEQDQRDVRPVVSGRELAAGNTDLPELREARVRDRLTPFGIWNSKGIDMNPSPSRLTLADLPALLLAAVSAVTVTVGARLLRGQDPVLMLALGIGVASATFMLEKLLVVRLNAITPRQSLLSLLVCWVPLFLFATVLATLATFSWIAPEIARRDLEESRDAHWNREAEKVSRYLLLLKTALRKQADATQMEIEAERRRVAAARVDGEAYSQEPLRGLQRKLAAAREVDRRVSALQVLPLQRPPEQSSAGHELDRVFRDLGDVQSSAMVVLADVPPFPTYEPFAPPSSDLQSVLAEETTKRSWRAMAAWGAAFWVDLLPVLTLWRGGRKVSLAVRVLHWRRAIMETTDAMFGRRAPTPLPILIEPLQVRGVVRVAMAAEYTLSDCTPLLEEAVGSLTSVLGSYRLRSISNVHGDNLDENSPLLPQLNGQPLVLSVVEGAR